ncbi:hypothetical protein M3G91_24480 [Micromonospora chalcea]|uniref:hypothetical protein n=1 Tax=Micromonospora chalcea TaxID=1874 RepID=UPI0021A40366|nr:hypothetical protein [Micromonospora chalcea]MCT2280779.1 hypothetical protein [Micromonospora chalcea]
MILSTYHVTLTIRLRHLTTEIDSGLLTELHAQLRLLQRRGVLGSFFVTGHRASRLLQVTVVVSAVRIASAALRAEAAVREAVTGLIAPDSVTFERLAAQPANS